MVKSIRCKKTKKLLRKYFSDGLPGRLKAELESHISSCEDCRKQVLAYNAVDRTVESLHLLPQDRHTEKEIPFHLKAKIFANIQAINSRPRFFNLRVCLKPLCIAVATAMLLLIPIKIVKKSHKEIETYNFNSFVADAIAEARAMNETEMLTAKTSDIIGIRK